MSAAVEWLAGWWNWPFLLPLLVGVLLILVDLLLGGVSDWLGGDGDVELDAEADGWLDAFGWLGVGQVPIAILVEVLCIAFGGVGLLVNAVVADLGLSSTAGFFVALVAALLVAPPVTRVVGKTVARIVPADASTARQPEAFLGEIAVTASLVTRSVGQVRIEARDGRPRALLNVRAADELEIPRGTEVLVLRWDAEKRLYEIAPLPKE